MPVNTSAAFGMAHQSCGSEWSWSSAADVNVRLSPRSMELTRMRRSEESFAITWIGYCPFSVTAAFSTVPPCSRQMGGVSLQPPAKSMRTGDVTHTT